MQHFVKFSVFAMILVSCKSPDHSINTLSSIESDPAETNQSCQFAERIWNNIYGTRYLRENEPRGVLPEFTGAATTAFEIYQDPTIAKKTFQNQPNDLFNEEIRRDSYGRPLRPKSIHAFGTVAKIKFILDTNVKNPYSGVFASGSPCGLVRISLGVKPTKEGIIPAAAFKFYIDRNGADISAPQSVNILAMKQVDPIPGFNPLEHDFSNILPPAVGTGQIFGSIYFKKALSELGAKDTNPARLTLEHVSQFRSDGTREVHPVRTPHRVTFVPTEYAKKLMASPVPTLDSDFRRELARFPSGKPLYDVYLDETETYHAVPYGIKVGQIVTQSEFVASKYGDQILHFAHRTAMTNSK
ncbi:MAG: hypothetical protein NTV34_17860 [Proteobacteria bacterium]|nr:hypothetical protein [Pseudomonadota bacterium]